MNEPNTPDEAAPQWAVIELMGHVRYGGRVSKDNQFLTAMLRVDVPQKDGTFVSQLVNPASIYRITFCAEAIARVAASMGVSTPLQQWDLRHLLPAPQVPSGDDAEDAERDVPHDPDETAF